MAYVKYSRLVPEWIADNYDDSHDELIMVASADRSYQCWTMVGQVQLLFTSKKNVRTLIVADICVKSSG